MGFQRKNRDGQTASVFNLHLSLPLMLKKVMRSIWGMRMTYLASVMVISVGILCYVALSTVTDRLVTSKEIFYEQYHFADVFIRLRQAPTGVLSQLTRMPGVERAEGRLSVSARVLTEDVDRIVRLRVYGIDLETAQTEQLNGLKVLGQPLQDSKDILLELPFYNAHGLSEGDSLELVVNGQRSLLQVRGAFQSPEYVYVMPDTGSVLPDPYTFEIAAVARQTLENLTGRRGVLTDIALQLSPGTDLTEIEASLRESLEGYGIDYITAREDQVSNQMLDMELNSIGSMSTAMSGLFLAVAAAILYIMLRRLIEQERTQIGVLKAFGYSNGRIVASYALYGIVTGLLGGILGALLGVVMSDAMFSLYSLYFSIPRADIPMSSGVVAYALRGVAASVATGTLAAVLGVRGTLKLRPSEAMRPPAPPLIKQSVFENGAFFERFFTKRGMMTLRYLERNKLKSSLIVISLALSYMLMAIMFSWTYLVDKLMLDQLTKVEKYDMKVSLMTPIPTAQAISSILSVEGVEAAEGILELGAVLRHDNLSQSTLLRGLNSGSALFKIVDTEERVYRPPDDGLLITDALAEDLRVSPGDLLTLESPLLKEDLQVSVAGVFRSSLGMGAYLSADSLNRLFSLPDVSNRVVLKAVEGGYRDIKQALIPAENISDVSDKEAILRSYQEMLATYSSMIYSILAMAVVIAFAIIYNISGVSLAERQRELATMRVLGYGPRETYEILSLENYLLCAISVVVGIPLTVLGMRGMNSMVSSDLFSMPTTIPSVSYLYASLSCILAVALSNVSLLRNLKKFELVEVLKERE